MIAAIARKELREMGPLIAAAALLQLFVLTGALGLFPEWIGNFKPGNTIPFLDPINDGDICFAMILVGGALAVGLGLGQTLWELFRGTFPMLLHRPLARWKMFAMKLAVGGVLWLVVTVLPLLIYALWAAAPGTHASPFAWWMTASAWNLCLDVLLFYLAAFLCGLRPARWYGSRFLPAAFPPALALALYISPFGAPVVTSILLLTIAIYTVAILNVAQTRDYS